MARPSVDSVIHRILVALDASAHSLAALEEAAALANRLQAELTGLFVEDINMARLAALPFARQISLPSGIGADIDNAMIELGLRAQAARAKAALESAAGRAGVRWSFRVARGRVAEEVIAAAGVSDLVILGWASRPLSLKVRLGSTARTIAARAPRSVLILRHGASLTGPLAVAYDGSPGSEKALAAAARLAMNVSGELTVLLLADEEAEVERLRAEAAARLEGHGVSLAYHALKRARPATVCAALSETGSGVLVLSADSPLLVGEDAPEPLDAFACPVLLVR